MGNYRDSICASELERLALGLPSVKDPLRNFRPKILKPFLGEDHYFLGVFPAACQPWIRMNNWILFDHKRLE
ncbi:MAG: hypothetical protein O6840_01750, partial [Nitrospirae bacterium]|nr:hypothetical protein [Nitrospirota bacterium]